MAEFNKIVHDKVKKIIEEGRMALTLGGDHSVGLGTVTSRLTADPDCVSIWVDVHADINTISSNIHSIPISFNIKLLEEPFLNSKLSWLEPSLKSCRIVYIGLIDVEKEEKKTLTHLNISAFYMTEVDMIGIVRVVEEALKIVDPLRQRNNHISFDIDSLAPLEAPATGTPVRGGLSLREVHHPIFVIV